MSKWYPRLFTFASPSLISIYKTAERIINSSLVTTCILNTYLSLLTFQALLHSRQCREHWSSEMLLMFWRKLCIPFSLTLASLLLSSAKIIIYYRSQNHINHKHTPWSGPWKVGTVHNQNTFLYRTLYILTVCDFIIFGSEIPPLFDPNSINLHFPISCVQLLWLLSGKCSVLNLHFLPE